MQTPVKVNTHHMYYNLNTCHMWGQQHSSRKHKLEYPAVYTVIHQNM
jgi:hypothetical protein